MAGLGAVMTAPLVGGCERASYSYRYKLTLDVEVAGEVKRAVQVVARRQYSVAFPHRGVRSDTDGEAVFLDLGPGRRPLVVLITRTDKSNPSYVHPYGLPLRKIYGGRYQWRDGRNDGLADLIRNRGARDITPDDLPDLVTFADPLVPSSVMRVDPHDIEATLGRRVRWHRMTLEFTDDDITTGIAKHLPWLHDYYDKMLDGRRPGQESKGLFASRMNTSYFWSGSRK